MLNRLCLVFPQWQGCALSIRLAEGAELIAQLPSETLAAQVATVPLELEAELVKQNQIVGYAPILKQFAAAKAILLEHDPERLLTIGGDCGVDVAPISFMNQRYPDLTLVWIDAHADLNTPTTSPSGHFHGMPLRTLLGEGDAEIVRECFSLLQPEQVILVGGRDFDPAEADFIKANDLTLVTVEEALSPQFAVLEQELQLRRARHVYIHLDLDVLEPSEFPYVSYNVANGFGIVDLTALVGYLARYYDVVGLSITEFAPDQTNAANGLPAIQGLIEAGLGNHD